VFIRQTLYHRAHRRARIACAGAPNRPQRTWRGIATSLIVVACIAGTTTVAGATGPFVVDDGTPRDPMSAAHDVADADADADAHHLDGPERDEGSDQPQPEGLDHDRLKTVLDELLEQPPENANDEQTDLVMVVHDGQGRPEVITVDADALDPDEPSGSINSILENPTIASIEWDLNWELFDDPDRHRQWALDVVGFESVWSQSTGAGVTVGVIDTGIAPHRDLIGRITDGYDFTTSTPLTPTTTLDLNGHGTHVAGIIAAAARNGIGIHGAAPDVSLMPLRVVADGRAAKWSDVAAAIRYATDEGASVINISLGGPTPSATVQAALDDARARGVVVVAAAGNGGSDPTAVYPAASVTTIGVGAVDQSRQRAPFSSSGSWVEVVAPGVSIMSTALGHGFEYRSGTSMAAPHVSALAAMLIAAAPDIAPRQIHSFITTTAEDLDVAGPDPRTGHGIISPAGALALVQRAAQGPGLDTSAARLLDTRAVGPMAADSTIRLVVSPAQSSARPAVLNVTAVHPATAGYLTVWDCNGPAVTSNLNFAAAETRANLVITGTDADGSVCIRTSVSTDLVVDAVPESDFGNDFTPLGPRRAVDTRMTGRLAAGEHIEVDLSRYLDSGNHAVVANVTAVHPDAAGYLSATPCGAAPNTSTVNFTAGQTAAASAIVSTSASKICVHTSTTTDVIVDVTGSFGSGTTAHRPLRALDTRLDSMVSAGQKIEIPITEGTGLAPTNVIAATVTAVEPTAAGFVTVWDCGAEPETSNLNFAASATVANAVISAVSSNQRLCLRSSVATHLLVDLTVRSAPAQS